MLTLSHKVKEDKVVVAYSTGMRGSHHSEFLGVDEFYIKIDFPGKR
jgi:hypothetical protein